jgi:hypothetical protein
MINALLDCKRLNPSLIKHGLPLIPCFVREPVPALLVSIKGHHLRELANGDKSVISKHSYTLEEDTSFHVIVIHATGTLLGKYIRRTTLQNPGIIVLKLFFANTLVFAESNHKLA